MERVRALEALHRLRLVEAIEADGALFRPGAVLVGALVLAPDTPLALSCRSAARRSTSSLSPASMREWARVVRKGLGARARRLAAARSATFPSTDSAASERLAREGSGRAPRVI